MASTRIDIVKDFFEALNKGDFDRAVVHFSEDATFRVISRSAQAVPETQGLAAYKAQRASRPKGEMHYEPVAIDEQKSCVVLKVGGKYTGPAKGDRDFIPINLSDVFRFSDDDRIIESWVFE
jgi:hypothetical protein